jgi:hypothetical protein
MLEFLLGRLYALKNCLSADDIFGITEFLGEYYFKFVTSNFPKCTAVKGALFQSLIVFSYKLARTFGQSFNWHCSFNTLSNGLYS